MGKRKFTLPTKVAAQVAKAKTPPGLKPPPTDPLDIIKGEILQLFEADGAESLDANVAAGERLLNARTMLPVGSFQKWIQQNMPFTSRTANRLIGLLHFHNSHPKIYKKLRPLGATRALQLIKHPPALIEQVVSQKHVVPGETYTKAPAQLSVDELWEVVNLLAGKKVNVDQRLLARVRRAANNLTTALKTLVAANAAIDIDDLIDVHDKVNNALDTAIAHYQDP